MLKFKKGVRVLGIRPEACIIIQAAVPIYSHYGYECIVTSVVDGQHSHKSLHYMGCSVDFRTRHMDPDDIPSVVASLEEALPSEDYDVVQESTHIHVEFQPERLQ